MNTNLSRCFSMILLVAVVVTASCSSLVVWRGEHGGVKYSIHTDKRYHRIERGKDGHLMYDSPELTVESDGGELMINGQPSGPVAEGDHVVVTDIGTVLVNGERRGDATTGKAQNDQRLRQTKALAKETAAVR